MGKVVRVRPHIERNSVEKRLINKESLRVFRKEYLTSIARFGVRTYPENNAFEVCCSVVSRVNVTKDIQDSRASPSHS